MSRSDKQKLVCGIGINDADYVVQTKETIGYLDGKRVRKLVWVCPFYQTWVSMLKRGYSEKCKLRHPTYEDVSVCKEWHLFSNFKKWMQQEDFEGKHLDKDLLCEGNKVYSPETCVFISQQVNNFLTDSAATRGEFSIGVHLHKQTGKFRALCRNPLTGKQEHLGLFTTEQEAHQAWLDKKLECAYAIATIQNDERVAEALIFTYQNYGYRAANHLYKLGYSK